MRRILLALVCITGLTGTARAQIPVTDAGAIANLVQQVKQGIQSLQLMQSQLAQAEAIYNSVSNVRSLSGALGAASTLGLTNNMPVNPFAVQSLLNGTGSTAGMLGSIGTLFNSNFAQNNVYTCTTTSQQCQLLKQQATSIAGQQGLAGELYQEMTQHITILQGLQTQLNASPDLQQTSYINGQISAQQAAINNLGAQTQALGVMQLAAVQSQRLQQDQKMQQNFDQVIAASPDQLP